MWVAKDPKSLEKEASPFRSVKASSGHNGEGTPLKGVGTFLVFLCVHALPCTQPSTTLLGGNLPYPGFSLGMETKERTSSPVFRLVMGIVFVSPDSEHY